MNNPDVRQDEMLTIISDVQSSLELGLYRVTVSQTANLQNCQIADASLDFYVTAEQLSLAKDEVYSVYPPDGSAGIFGDCIPHIILKRRTLPWERKLPGFPAKTPWMALLVFSEEEETVVQSLSYEEAARPRQGLYIPALDRSYTDDKECCTIVDIPYRLFTQVMPRADDLPLLAHARRVRLEDKVTDPSVREDWFSCVVANRYPDVPKQEPGTYRMHKAHLVSLEGFDTYLLNKSLSHPIMQCEQVRMFSLAQWSFAVTDRPFDFKALVQELKPSVSGVDDGDYGSYVKKQIRCGYYPVEHQFREGSLSVSWYRPPLLPQEGERESIPICRFSDHLLRYDPETSMFDISYSAAWQLGRLLCLQNKEMPGRIMRWRHQNRQQAVRRANGMALAHRLPRMSGASLVDYDEDSVRNSCLAEWKRLMNALIGSAPRRE